ncbi:hypothetical protein RJ639_014098 [Escallonia herrerae]|uniref:RNase H type-1 domain-containing protein n=1 Tax=Escallonia herrerae TaxID=1293975 RepID=A0AA88VLH8_9ASTE|nr:hypothetical protein RJ639_014098 [Escallonia herrerae]
MKMKFPTEYGVGEVKGDQVMARQCYMVSYRTKNNETLVIEDLRDKTKIKKGKPVEDLLDIELYLGDKEKTVRIGIGLTEDLKLKLINLLRSYSDIFAWTAFDMPGIDPEVITHKLNIDPLKKSIKQKKRKVLQNLEALGRLVNWLTELGEIDIKYKPRVAIKAQALSDFIMECTVQEDPPRLVLSETSNPWLLYVDGSSKIDGGGAGLMLISLEKFMIEYALHFDFRASNNEAEYEALLVGIRLAHSLKVDSLSVHNDSLLVVNQILGEYEARDERMIQYLQVVKIQAAKFSEEDNEANLRENFDLLDDVRVQALKRVIATKQRVARHYNRRVHTKLFRIGDLVLRKLEVSDPKAAVGKLSPNWEGPYRISKVHKPGASHWKHCQGTRLLELGMQKTYDDTISSVLRKKQDTSFFGGYE